MHARWLHVHLDTVVQEAGCVLMDACRVPWFVKMDACCCCTLLTFKPSPFNPHPHIPHALLGSLPPSSLVQHQDYTYYGLASPWLQVKCLRVLQYFPPPEEPSVRRTLVDVVKRILGGALLSLGLFVVLLLPVVLHGVHALDVRIGRSVWRP